MLGHQCAALPLHHGYEVRHQKTGILTNGDTGFELSSLISNWTNELTIYSNGKSTLTEEQTNKLRQNNISIVETEIARLDHKKGYVKNIIFKDGSTAMAKAIYARLPFVQHSPVPQSLGCELTPEGYIKTDMAQLTTVPRYYCLRR